MIIIIVISILTISIGLLLAGLYSTIRINIEESEDQERLNNRILESLPDNFRLDN